MRKLFFSVLAFFSLFGLYAQDAASVFIDMPRNKIMLLTDDNRKDMVDLFLHGGKERAKTANVFGGESALTELTPDYLRLQLTAQNRLELKLLPSSDGGKVIAVVRTACAPVCDSRIEFYSLAWEPLNIDSLMPVLRFELFLNDKERGSEARQNALAALDASFFKYELNTQNTNLNVTFTTPGLLGKEERKQLEPYLSTQPLILQWTAEGFQY